jgi:ribonuclease E
MIEATTKACPHCHGTGRTRSDDSMALALLREIEEEGVRQRSKEVLIVAPVEIANYLLNRKREHIAMIEGRFGLSVRVEGDGSLVSPDYRVERFKTASRVIAVLEGPALLQMAPPEEEFEVEDDVADEAEAEVTTEETTTDKPAAGKRKRRRRRRGGGRNGSEPSGGEVAEPETSEGVEHDGAEQADVAAPAAEEAPEPEVAAEPAKGGRRRRTRGKAGAEENAPPAVSVEPAAEPFPEAIEVREDDGPDIVEVPEAGTAPQRRPRERVRRPAAAVLAASADTAVTPADVAEAPAAAPEVEHAEAGAGPEGPGEAESGSKRRGWWSRALGGS